MRSCLAALVVTLGLGVATPGVAQEIAPLPLASMVSAHLKDGSVIIGRLDAQGADSVQITTNGARMSIARAAITELKVINAADVHDGTYWPPDPHDTRLFFGPTGRTLSAGSGYFSDQYLFLMNVAVGVTDRFTLGAGMSLLPTQDFFHDNVYYATGKFAIVRGETFNLAAGALVGYAGRGGSSAGMYYLAGTSGRPNGSVTYGLGYAYFNDKVTGDATLMLGGNARVSRHVALMTENYIFTGPGGGYWAPMYGVRFVGEHLSTDVGFVTFAGPGVTTIFPGAPWLGFAFKF